MMTSSDDQGIEMMTSAGFPPVPRSIEIRRFEDLEQQASASSLHDQSASSFWTTDQSLVRHDSQLSLTPLFQQRTTAVVARDVLNPPIIQPQEQAPPIEGLLPRLLQPPALPSEDDGQTATNPKLYQVRRLIKYIPLTVWAIVLTIAATLITVHLVNASPEEPSSDVTAMGTNTKSVNECLRAIRAHFMGVDAYRLDVGAPQFSATEWLAVDDEVCSYLDLNSTRLEQRYALLTVYFALGASKSTLRGWDNEPGVHECDWANVACDATFDKVTSIRIGASETQDPGYLPEEIGLLSSLTTLEIVDSRIGGTLPIGLYSLTNLETLDVSRNSIGGSIPSLIGRLSNLRNLNLRYNRFDGTLSHEIASLGSLRIFNVQQNDISGNVWKYIESWPHLETFDVAGNEKIVGTIPTEIGTVTNLRVLDARSSQTSGTIPTEIGKLESLEVFKVLLARLKGSLPSELGQLSLLENLAIDDNDLEGTIPTEIGLCSSLETMEMEANKFDGTLPSELGLLVRLTTLDASHNNMHGVIPETFERLTDLEVLNLGYNMRLAGEMPPGLCDIQGADIRVACTVSCTCCTYYQCK